MCQGITTKGTKCKRKDDPYCKDHLPVNIIKNFPLSLVHCTSKITKRIKLLMEKGPSKSDSKGHIYIYTINTDKEDTYYKIGRTSRDVDKRLKEWKGAICKKSWKVNCQKYAEKLIHTYLDYVRVYRYEISKEEGLCTIWKSTGIPVEKSDQILKDKYKLEARTKMIEWFRINWKELEDIIKKIMNIEL